MSEKQDFVNHASSCHPESIYFLAKIEDESMTNVNLPWLNEEKVKFLKKKWVANSTKWLLIFAGMAHKSWWHVVGILQKDADFMPKIWKLWHN